MSRLSERIGAGLALAALALLGGALVVSVVLYARLPSSIPVHYAGDTPDTVVPRWLGAFLVPICGGIPVVGIYLKEAGDRPVSAGFAVIFCAALTVAIHAALLYAALHPT